MAELDTPTPTVHYHSLDMLVHLQTAMLVWGSVLVTEDLVRVNCTECWTLLDQDPTIRRRD